MVSKCSIHGKIFDNKTLITPESYHCFIILLWIILWFYVSLTDREELLGRTMVTGFCWRLFTFDFSNKFRQNSEIFLKVTSHQNNVCGRLVLRQLTVRQLNWGTQCHLLLEQDWFYLSPGGILIFIQVPFMFYTIPTGKAYLQVVI